MMKLGHRQIEMRRSWRYREEIYGRADRCREGRGGERELSRIFVVGEA